MRLLLESWVFYFNVPEHVVTTNIVCVLACMCVCRHVSVRCVWLYMHMCSCMCTSVQRSEEHIRCPTLSICQVNWPSSSQDMPTSAPHPICSGHHCYDETSWPKTTCRGKGLFGLWTSTSHLYWRKLGQKLKHSRNLKTGAKAEATEGEAYGVLNPFSYRA